MECSGVELVFRFAIANFKRRQRMMKRATNAAVADAVTTGSQPLTTAEECQLDAMTKAELFTFAETIEVTLDPVWNKPQCVDALRIALAARKGFVGGESVPPITHCIRALNALLNQN